MSGIRRRTVAQGMVSVVMRKGGGAWGYWRVRQGILCCPLLCRVVAGALRFGLSVNDNMQNPSNTSPNGIQYKSAAWDSRKLLFFQSSAVCKRISFQKPGTMTFTIREPMHLMKLSPRTFQTLSVNRRQPTRGHGRFYWPQWVRAGRGRG